jgi:peptidoglycan/LPS O-acetylase OafA/YrhL
LYLVTLAPVVTAKALQGHSIHGWLDHVLALQAWSPSLREAYAFDGPAWSIWVEVVLYACFPLLALALARVCSMRALAITGIVTLAAMLGLVIWFVATHRSGLPWESSASAHRWLYRTPITRLGDFLIGMLIARAYFKARDRPYAARMGEALSITGALAILLLMIWPRFLSRRGAGIWGM